MVEKELENDAMVLKWLMPFGSDLKKKKGHIQEARTDHPFEICVFDAIYLQQIWKKVTVALSYPILYSIAR